MTEEIQPNWPDCHHVQCRQVHETLDSLLDMLNVECPRHTYAVGKMIRICEAIKPGKLPAGALTSKDIEFLIWCLGFVQGRILVDSAREEIAQRCRDIWPKLSELL